MSAPGTLEVVELDDRLDFEPSCTLHNETQNCTRPVAWVARPSCCGRIELACQVARDIVDDWMLRARGIGLVHVVCKRPALSFAWTPYEGGRS